MFKTIKYISTLTVAGVSLAACSDGIINNSEEYTISGTGEKTPLEISVTLQDIDPGSKTRAVDGSFETGDQLIAYVQQVEANNATISSETTFDKKISKLITWNLSKKAIDEAEKSNNQMTVTSDNKDDKLGMTLYWDDFSNSTDDIRGEQRFLRVGYGYCYNGGTPSPALTENTGILGWTVQEDQTDAANEKKSDLLWASASVPFNADNYVKYEHVVSSRKPLPVTYRHAMSKVTIELVLDEGFAKDTNNKAVAFGNNNTTPTLYANKVATEVDAINQTIKVTEVSGDAAKITMHLADDETTAMHRVYEAIIAPTVMKAGNVLAEVTVDGNKYELKLTDDLLKTLPTDVTGSAWSSQLSGYDNTTSGTVVKTSGSYDTSKGGITQSGVNYRLVATLKKQRIEVQAMILPWNDVYASTTGKISFDADVFTSDVKDATVELTTGSFDLWRSEENEENKYDFITSTDNIIDKASTFTYNTTSIKWEAKSGENILYWENATTPYYFRALAKAKTYNSTGIVTEIETVEGSTAVSQTTKDATVDLLWAQTSKHEIKNANNENYKDDNDPTQNKVIAAGAAIDPRTGTVPLTFQHAMSKISVVLQTSTVDAEKVNLTDAKISIINLYNGGTISVSTGEIGDLTLENSSDPMTIKDVPATDMTNYLVIPQSLVNLKDGTLRTTTPVFYSSDELTAIYPSENTEYDWVTSEATSPIENPTKNTSIGSGTPNYYLTRELTAVPAVKYQDNDDGDRTLINAYNASLKDENGDLISKKSGDLQTPEVLKVLYTYERFVAAQKHKEITAEQFDKLSNAAKEKIAHKDAEYFTALDEFRLFLKKNDKGGEEYEKLSPLFREKESYSSVDEYNSDKTEELTSEDFTALPAEQKVKSFYTYSEFENASGDLYTTFTDRLKNDEIVPKDKKCKSEEVQYIPYTYTEYIALDMITENMFNALPDDINVRIEIEHQDAVYYTAETANAYNYDLPGAIHFGDVKIPAYYKLPEGQTLTSHKAGDLVENSGNKIVMYIFLNDGTRYSAELSKFEETTGTDSDGNPVYGDAVTEWKSNKHYHYTVTLAKEKISFRALVKKWEEKNVGGSATLDWD